MTRAARRRGLAALVAGGCLAAVAAVGTAGGAEPAQPAAPSAQTAPAAPLVWTQCPDSPRGIECSSVQVPVDWAQPGGPAITVRFNRRRADHPRKRVGTLFFHPGGPGDGAISYVAHARAVFTPAVRARFDLIGIDPRGFGASTPIRCGLPTRPRGYRLFPRTRAEFQRMVDHNTALGESCLRETGPLVGHADAASVAEDMEAVRAALGVPKLDYLGLSYGTQVGAIYAERHPDRVRSMVLDASLEHAAPLSLMIAGEINSVEDAFDRFARWCRTARTCALRGQPVGRVYDRLVARAERHPMPVRGAEHPVTGEDIRLGTGRFLTFKEPTIFGPTMSWAALSRAIRAAVHGDATGFAVAHLTPDEANAEYNSLAVSCGDYGSDVHTWAEMRRRLQLGRRLAPHLQGASQFWTSLQCAGWPLPPSNPPRRLDVRGVPPILLVNATHDPSTNYVWAHSLAEQIEGSVLLTRIGDGHTSYFTSHCAQAAIDRYLVTGRTPRPDAVCRH